MQRLLRRGLSAVGLAAALALPAAAPAGATPTPEPTEPPARPAAIGDCADQGVRRGHWSARVHTCLVGGYRDGILLLAGRTTVTAGQARTRVSEELVRLGTPRGVLTEDTTQRVGHTGKVGPVTTKFVPAQGCSYRIRVNYSVRWPDNRLSRYTTLTPTISACLASTR